MYKGEILICSILISVQINNVRLAVDVVQDASGMRQNEPWLRFPSLLGFN